jgi:hypothetical protein
VLADVLPNAARGHKGGGKVERNQFDTQERVLRSAPTDQSSASIVPEGILIPSPVVRLSVCG